MKALTILRKIVFGIMSTYALICQLLGTIIILILVGIICHHPVLFSLIALAFTILDIIRHKWLVKNGYGVPVMGQYVNKKKAKDINDRIEDYERHYTQ